MGAKKKTRRSFPDAFKIKVVAQSLRPGAVIKEVAEDNDLWDGMVHRWRRIPRLRKAAEAKVARKAAPANGRSNGRTNGRAKNGHAPTGPSRLDDLEARIVEVENLVKEQLFSAPR